jgi:hypothetical protein
VIIASVVLTLWGLRARGVEHESARMLDDPRMVLERYDILSGATYLVY